jgi:hypothetical protein
MFMPPIIFLGLWYGGKGEDEPPEKIIIGV